MATKQKNKPKERVRAGKISLLQWENLNSDGKAFDSFSLNKTITKIDEKDRSKFSGRILSLNGLTKTDLTHVRQAIDEMQDKVTGVDDLSQGERLK